MITPVMTGGTLVEWSLHPQFADAGPYTFQLQGGRTGLHDADDWINLGAVLSNTYSAVDSEQRDFGQMQRWHYRLKLSTSNGVYYSDPQAALGNLSQRDWSLVREISRQALLRLKNGAGRKGFLLKRRLAGERCPECLDKQTDEILNSSCTVCYGTGFLDGYFAPFPCFYVEQTPWKLRSHQDQMAPGNEQVTLGGRMLAVPRVFSYDVWVDADTDQRWIIHGMQAEVEIRGLPVILYPVEMRLAPFTNVIYRFPLE